jgi:hypothetical protein
MGENGPHGEARVMEEQSLPPLAHDTDTATPLSWELIDNGRYRPLRIRGSFRGRELG